MTGMLRLQVYLMEELLSPFVTPFILCFKLRHKSLDIVDFFRNFTIDVAGVGDVCSFAQLDVKRHGHPEVCDNLICKAIYYKSNRSNLQHAYLKRIVYSLIMAV